MGKDDAGKEDDAMNYHEESFEDDELMQKISKPPEFPAAKREQVEQTWQAITGHIEAQQAATARHARPAPQTDRRALPDWLQSLFPAAPAWSWQFAKVAALIVVGFGVAWIAAGQGWLPGTTSTDVVSVPEGSGDTVPDRAWLAANGYSSRLEALFLGVAKGDPTADGGVATAAREVSRELLSDNRFYERVAQRNDDAALSELLSRVEVILLALATAPEGQEQEVINALREFINESDVLGELREVQSSVPKLPRPRVVTIGS
jgi:hypothetical protein